MAEERTNKSLVTLLAGVMVLVLGGLVFWKSATPAPESEPTPVASSSERPQVSDRREQPEQPDRQGDQNAGGNQDRPQDGVASAPGPVEPAPSIPNAGVPLPVGPGDIPPGIQAGIDNPPPFVRAALANPPPQATILPPEPEPEPQSDDPGE